MPKFSYRARKGTKKLEQGTIEAESESAVVRELTQRGYFPISISAEAESVKKKTKRIIFFRNIPNRDLSTFTRQLSNLLESGLTLYKALTVLHKQTENERLVIIIQDIAGLVKEGKSLSESLRSYPKIFNNMYVSMVSAGEMSGALDMILKRLADFGEKQEDALAKVQVAMAYPIIMVVVGMTTLVVLFTFVIPKLVELFEDMGQVLPLPTRMLIAISDLFVNFWWLMLAAVAFIFFVSRRHFSTSKGKIRLDRFKLSLPVLGKFFKKIQISSFSHTLGTLLANGVPMLQALKAVLQTVENEVFKEGIKLIIKEIREGSTLACGVAKSKCFPVLVVNMISIGEERGALESALSRLAQAYEKEIDQSIRLLTSLIEPLMILLMGSVVGFVVISMLLPIFQISLITG